MAVGTSAVTLAALLLTATLAALLGWSERAARDDAERLYAVLRADMMTLTVRTRNVTSVVAAQRELQRQLKASAAAWRDAASDDEQELQLVLSGEAALRDNTVKSASQRRSQEDALKHDLDEAAEEMVDTEITLKARLGERSRGRLLLERLRQELEDLRARIVEADARVADEADEADARVTDEADEADADAAKADSTVRADTADTAARADEVVDDDTARDDRPAAETLDPSAFVVIYVVDGSVAAWVALRSNLQLLDANLLACSPHAVHVFADGSVPAAERALWETLVPHASRFTVELVCFETCVPPGSDDLVQLAQSATGVFRPQTSALNRFLSGPLYAHPAFEHSVAYLFLDVHTYIADPLPEDPFARFLHSGCDVATAKIAPPPATATEGERALMSAAFAWLQDHAASADLGAQWQPDPDAMPEPFRAHAPWPDATLPHVTAPIDSVSAQADVLWRATVPPAGVTQFYDTLGRNAEEYVPVAYGAGGWAMGRFAAGRTAAYQSLFRQLDIARGFYTHGWTAEHVRAMAAALLSSGERVCQVVSLRNGRWPVVVLSARAAASRAAQRANDDDLKADATSACGPRLDPSLDAFYSGVLV